MPQENVEVAKRGYAALNEAYRSGDVNDFLPHMKEHFDPDVLLAPAGVLPESGTVHGWDGILGFIAEQMKAFEDGSMWLEPTEYIDTDDCLVVPYRFGGRARHTGIDVDFDFVHVGTTRDGKTIRIDVYETLPQAVQAAGLRD